MQQITSITSQPKQRMQLVLDNNETCDFELFFSLRNQAWYFSFAYKDTKATFLKVVLTPNALRQFKNIIPFGIMFSTTGYVQPFKLDDFSSGRISMFVLNEDEVLQVEQEVYNEEI